MLVITELLSPSEKNAEELIHTFSNILNYEPENSLFFDIETTGLSAANSMVFLIGAIYFDGKDWQLKQLMAQNAEDERCILEEFFDLAHNYHTLIHFNGTTFDLPYVKERACHHRLSHSLNEMNSLDLYQKFRPLKKLLNLPRMNQQTLEQFLEWPRQDQLTGKHMISLFKKYAASGEKLIADLLLLHNHDDLVGMTQLLRFAAYQMLFEGKVAQVQGKFISHSMRRENSSQRMADPQNEGQVQCFPDQPLLQVHDSLANPSRNVFCIQFFLDYPLPVPLFFNWDEKSITPDLEELTETYSNTPIAPFLEILAKNPENKSVHPTATFKTSDLQTNYRLSIIGNQGILEVSCFQGELKYFFPDYRNYFYLPVEDQAIHKSVGSYVDPAYRENAKPVNCYVKKQGCFLPQPTAAIEPVFRPCYNSKEIYFEWSEDFYGNQTQILMYLHSVLQMIFKL